MRLALLIFSFFFSSTFCCQTPLRKAALGISTSTVNEGLRIDSVTPGLSAAVLGISKGDVILTLNGSTIGTKEDLSAKMFPLRSGDALEIEYLHKGQSRVSKGRAIQRPYETSDFADLLYEWVKYKNGLLRTITYKPKNKKNTPCILLIPGYGCGSIENFSKSYNGKLINEWLKNGYAVVTIEKSGMGDSFGCTPCSDVDLATDIETYSAGYTFMEQLDFVDKTALFIWGHSLGGMIAPEIAKKHSPRGVMVFGTVFRPWNEFLLEMHRVQKPLLENMNLLETEKFVRLMQKVYYEFFVLKRSPAQLYENKEFQQIVSSEMEYKAGSNTMWGRHWRFWQQIDSLNLAASWQQLNCAVLVLNGGTDYEQCAPIEPELIGQAVNASHPGNASVLEIEDLDHFMMKSDTRKEALENFRTQQYSKGNFNYKLSDATLNWLNKLCRKS